MPAGREFFALHLDDHLAGLVVGVCALFAGLTALGIEGFTNEGRRASLWLGFSVVSGAIAGALAAGALTVSLSSGELGMPDSIPTAYWYSGPGLAVMGGLLRMLVERNHGC